MEILHVVRGGMDAYGAPSIDLTVTDGVRDVAVVLAFTHSSYKMLRQRYPETLAAEYLLEEIINKLNQ